MQVMTKDVSHSVHGKAFIENHKACDRLNGSPLSNFQWNGLRQYKHECV